MLEGCAAWPAAHAARYRRDGYWQGATVDALLRERARDNGSRTALVGAGQRWTYAELEERVGRFAAGLVARGVRRSDRVVLQLPNSPTFVVCLLGLFRMGALPVMALPAHRRHEVEYLCRASGAVAYVGPDRHQGFDFASLGRDVRAAVPGIRDVIVDGDAEGVVALSDVDADPLLPSPTDPSDVALFLLSGGTTGMSKLIPRTHDDYAYNVGACARASAMDERSVQLIVLPMQHNGALGCPGILGSLATGGTAVLSSDPSPDEAFPLISTEGVTLTTLVPPLALLWLEAAKVAAPDLRSLRLVQIGGAKLPERVAARIRPELGADLQQWFGLAEGFLCHTRLDDPEHVRVSTQGRPLSAADELHIVDPEGREVGSGATGELLVRGPTTFRGYYAAGEHNARCFTSDGFFRTGDLVRRGSDGNLTVVGRVKDVINRGGEKVPAEEVEAVLLNHPAVLDAAVVAMPDAVLGERSCAFVIPRGRRTLTLQALQDHVRQQGLAEYKVPDRLEIVEAFPHTSVGKVSKATLRHWAAGPRGCRRT